MIGWKPKPFIFVHIPKCAGTSIEKALIPIVSDHKDFRDFSEDERSYFWLPGKKGLQHRKLKRYEQHFEINTYFKFSFVRNPWDRAISQIEYLQSKTGKSLFPSDNFKEHIRVYCKTNKNVWGHDLGACQVDYLLDLAGKLRMDFIGRFESLEKDFATICGIIGLKSTPQLPHIFNSQRKQHYSTFYDEESATWINERFLKDIEIFNYKYTANSSDILSHTPA